MRRLVRKSKIAFLACNDFSPKIAGRLLFSIMTALNVSTSPSTTVGRVTSVLPSCISFLTPPSVTFSMVVTRLGFKLAWNCLRPSASPTLILLGFHRHLRPQASLHSLECDRKIQSMFDQLEYHHHMRSKFAMCIVNSCSTSSSRSSFSTMCDPESELELGS